MVVARAADVVGTFAPATQAGLEPDSMLSISRCGAACAVGRSDVGVGLPGGGDTLGSDGVGTVESEPLRSRAA
jgi:hypothetical protein